MTRVSGTRWLFVDDGSTDDTAEFVRNLDLFGETVHLMVLEVNSGKAEAVRRGLLDVARDEDLQGIGFMDGDGAFSVEDLFVMIQTYGEFVVDGDFHAVWSSRVGLAGRDIVRKSHRHYLGRIITTVLGTQYKNIPYDTQSGFKIFRASTEFITCIAAPFRTRWLFEVEMLARWSRYSSRPMRIMEVPLWHWHDIPGSKIRGREVMRIAGELGVALGELRSVKRHG